MTALQHDPSAHAPWTRTMLGRIFMSVIPFLDSRPTTALVSFPVIKAGARFAGRYDERYYPIPGCSQNGAVSLGYDAEIGIQVQA
jgi:hypothetical protein